MAKDKSEKKERKEKKDKLSSSAATIDDGGAVKKAKKEKKDKKSRASTDGDAAGKLLAALEDERDLPLRNKQDADGDLDMDDEGGEVKATAVVGQLVPFANPLADDKGRKKIMKGVKKGKLFPLRISFFSTSVLPSSPPHSTLGRGKEAFRRSRDIPTTIPFSPAVGFSLPFWLTRRPL